MDGRAKEDQKRDKADSDRISAYESDSAGGFDRVDHGEELRYQRAKGT